MPFGGGEIYFVDGRGAKLADIAESSSSYLVEDGVTYNAFDFSIWGSYIIRYSELNRNDGALNMSDSVDTPFYVKTKVVLDPIIGMSDSPWEVQL